MTTVTRANLPNDPEAELDVLARIISRGQEGAIHLVADTLRPQHFYNRMNETIYEAALAVVDAGQPVNAGTVHAWLKDHEKHKHSDGTWVSVQQRLLADVEYHVPRLKLEQAAARLREKHALRQTITAAQRIVAEAQGDVGEVNDFLAAAESSLHAVSQELRDGVAQQDVFSMYDLVREIRADIEDQKPREFVPTGCADLDEDMGGFELGFVTVLGAPTNWGKTGLVVMFYDEAERAEKNSLIVSFEDPPKLYARRYIARQQMISAWALKHRRLGEADKIKLQESAQYASLRQRGPFVLRANGRPIENIVRRVRRICQTQKIDQILWDYLQAAKCKERLKDKRERVEFAAREMTDCTKEVGAAGVIVSQLRRLDGEEPTIHHLKESGDIENGAENILLGFNDAKNSPRLRLAKNKDGVKNVDYGLVWEPMPAAFRASSRIERSKTTT